MDLLKLSDAKLAELRQAVANESKRRTTIAVNGFDTGAVIYGNEIAKRAVTIAAAGGHSILFVGPGNSGKTMLRALCLQLGIEESYEARPCPCGNFNDPIADCRCTTKQIERAIAKFPMVDISVEVHRPRDRDKSYKGTSLADLHRQIEGMSHFNDEALDQHGGNLLKAASRELGLDIVAVARILGVARTIANLDRSEQIQPVHVSEAINYRMLNR